MADNYLEKKFEDMRASGNGTGREERARREAWKKRMAAAEKRLEEERRCVQTYFLDVAGHVFKVIVPDVLSPEDHLGPYLPFRTEGDREPLFTLRVALTDSLASVPSGRVRDCMNDEAPYLWLMEKNGHFNFGFSYTRERRDCILMPSLEYTDNVLYVQRGSAGRIIDLALSNALMLLYTYKTAPYDTLMVHASVVVSDGGGYMFLGKSGTGKSTHSRLWIENIAGTVLLNDDNPVVRVHGDNVTVYGTPWSGKTPCYRNENVPLKAFVRLSQAPYNRIGRLPILNSYASLLPSCSCMRWDRASTDALHSAVEKVVSKVGGWHLECLPDAEAALLCSSEIQGKERI